MHSSNLTKKSINLKYALVDKLTNQFYKHFRHLTWIQFNKISNNENNNTL